MKSVFIIAAFLCSFLLSGCIDTADEKDREEAKQEQIKQEKKRKGIMGDGVIKKYKPGEAIPGL